MGPHPVREPRPKAALTEQTRLTHRLLAALDAMGAADVQSLTAAVAEFDSAVAAGASVKDGSDALSEVPVLATDGGGAKHDTPLIRAARRGLATATRRLLAAGADPSAEAKNGATPLYVACYYRHDSVVSLLFEAGGHLKDVPPQQPATKSPRKPKLKTKGAEVGRVGAVLREMRGGPTRRPARK